MASIGGLRAASRLIRPSTQLLLSLNLFGVNASASKVHFSAVEAATSWSKHHHESSLGVSSNSPLPHPLPFMLLFVTAISTAEVDSDSTVACDPCSSPEDLRDAVMAQYTSSCSARDVSKRFNGVHTAKVKAMLSEVQEMVTKAKNDDHPLASQMEFERSSSHDESKFVYRWVSTRCGAKILKGSTHTESELKAGAYAILSGKVQANHAFTLYGFSNPTFRRFVEPVCKLHNCKNVTESRKQ